MLLPSLSKVNWFGSKLPGTSSSCPLLSVTIQLVKTKEETKEEDEEKETFAFEMENRKKWRCTKWGWDEWRSLPFFTSHFKLTVVFFAGGREEARKGFGLLVLWLLFSSLLASITSSLPIPLFSVLKFCHSHPLTIFKEGEGMEIGMRKVMTNMCKNNNSSLKGIQLQFQFHSICTFLPCSFPVSHPHSSE